jgi:multiple sugar transport system permease protein
MIGRTRRQRSPAGHPALVPGLRIASLSWQRLFAWYRHANRLGDLSAAAICLLPALLVLGMFSVYPMVYAGYLSLVRWDGLAKQRPFVGLANYRRLWESGDLRNAIEATLIYAAGVTAGGLVISLVIAVLLESLTQGRTLYRTLYFLPVITATVAVAVVWKLLLDPGSGYVNVVLRNLGLTAPSWLRDPTWAMPAVVIVGVWKRLGFNIVVYLAGLQSVPRDVQEAAAIDGASAFATFRDVTLPLLAPTTLLLAIMSVVDAFLVFDQIYIMTGGGPIGRTEVLGLLLYRQAFRYFDLGGAAAIGWVMFGMIAGISLVQWRLYGAGTREVGT